MIKPITDAVKQTIRDSHLKKLLAERKNIELQNFTGSLTSYFLQELRGLYSHIVVITPDIEKTASYISDIQVFSNSTALFFPPTNNKPYDDQRIPDLSVMVQRSEVLEKLKTDEKAIVFTSADALTEKLIPADEFQKKSITIERGQLVSPENLREQLTEQGYRSVKFVDEPGEYAVRGGIFDVYPFSGDYPVRLEFFGDEIESIREFDTDSQRSVSFLSETRFVPGTAFESGQNKQSLFDYLPENTVLFLYQPDLILGEIKKKFESADKIYQTAKDRRLSKPESEYLTPDEYTHITHNRPLIASGGFYESISHFDESISLNTSPHPEFGGSFKILRSYITENSESGIETVILCNNKNQSERFEELLGEPDHTFNYRLILYSLHGGFVLKDKNIAVLTDHQIFNRYHRPKLKSRKSIKGGISFKELKDLNIGDYVVHVDYGIAKFAGFKKIEVRDTIQEAAVLRYKDNSILYVNVSSLHKIQKYSGKEGTAPRITKLGSGEWARKKSKTKSKVKDIARDLIQLYAKRKAQHAYTFSPDTAWQTEMEARFEFEETPDQMEAIQAVKRDMESEQPMDRLICGDVGFGKTEVAIRAAFKAVMDQKQVAILVPTTILADQHFKTFTDRMDEFPIRVEVLSRFRTTAEQKEVLKNLKSGKVDILIGTHRIVSKDVQFKNLGLLIIDEEQRFGVSVKEKLKKFRAAIDVMTLTATPIPRTLQFSLMGARDLSIINTPPPNRQPVYTEIHSFNHELIRDGLIQEISRGGQVFFIHNRVKNIEEVADMIRQLVPDVRVKFAHGQLSASRLEKIIHDFYNHKFDVLVSTNIVENGIDIANANTIFINNANHFGLSELHQLRGRVGRSNRKAFCYLMTPPIQTLTTEARKRLRALEEFSDLGSGFNIAMRDLDIRGAGDILGAEQSGFINDLGFEMYTKILDDAVRELKQGEFSGMFESEPVKIDYPDTTVEFDYSALLDSDYVSDSVERLNLYRKLSEADEIEEFTAWEEEMKDRFGPLPQSAQNLLLAAKIKHYASRLFYKKVTMRSERMWLLCPNADHKTGKNFFDTGLFQNQLNIIQKQSGENYKIVQKKDSVRIIIQDISDPLKALEYLKRLYDEQHSHEEIIV
jgi:transcription-repair coupling factor (superfamily II helicase)